ncbi:MAG: TIGR04076 family protein [Chloroflexi bacterium]|nr:TIGR04076 family protein [Chloroflexota bacterium]
MTEKADFRVIGTIKSVRGTCSAGHKVGDQLEVSCMNSGSLCGFFYHDIFPYLFILEYGSGFPPGFGEYPDMMDMRCPDNSKVIMEIRRIKK